MTVERKIVVGLEDIKAISLECKTCHARLTVTPEKISVPKACKSCNIDWFPCGMASNHVTTSAPAPMVLANAIQRMRTLTEESAIGFILLLEFEEPKS